MGWAAIISALVSIFGPLLGDLIKKWLDKLLNKAAGLLPPRESFGSEPSAVASLYDKAIELTRGRVRRALLRRLRAVAVARAEAGGSGELSAADAEEIAGLGAAAK